MTWTCRFFRLRWLIGGVALLALAIGFAPTIIGKTPLRNWLANATLGLNGSVSIGEASLDWFSPIKLRDVEIVDSDGSPLIRAQAIASDKSIWEILTGTADLGHFQVDHLHLQLTVAGKTTNLESVLAPLLYGNDQSSSFGGASVSVKLDHAQITVTDRDSSKNWELALRDLNLVIANDGFQSLAGEGEVGAGSPIKLDFQSRTPDQGRLSTQAKGLPLDLAACLLRRFEGMPHLAGLADLMVECDWETNENGTCFRLNSDLSAKDIKVAGGVFGSDRFEIKKLQLPCQLECRDQQIHVKQLELLCDFGKAQLDGTLLQSGDLAAVVAQPGYHLKADLDLARLSHALSHTLRLQEDTRIVEGRLLVDARSTATETGPAWQGSIRTTKLDAINAGKPWHWPQPLLVTFAAHQDEKQQTILDRLQCNARFLSLSAAGNLNRLAVRAHCDLEELVRLVDLGPIRLAGQVTAGGLMRYSPKQLVCDRLEMKVKQLRCDGPGIWIHEPQATLKTSASWNAEASIIEVQSLRLDSEAIAVQVPQFQIVSEPQGWKLAGDIAAQGDLARIGRWLNRPGAAARPWIAGRLDGKLTCHGQPGALAYTANLNVGQMVIGPPAKPYWNEPHLQVASHGKYDVQADALQLDQLKIDGAMLACDTAGSLTQLSSSKNVYLAGQLRYDLERLNPVLRSYLGNDCSIAGQNSSAMEIKGSLATANGQGLTIVQLEAGAELAWRDAALLGCRLGPARTRVQLKDGWLRTGPVDASVNEGRLHVEPSLRLAPSPLTIYVERGRLLDRARITPELCAGALGVAVPVLARVAEVDGLVSVATEGGQLPLADPDKASIEGKVTLHSAHVGASPLVRQLSSLIGGPPTLTIRSESVVPFKLQNGRVFHRDLELKFTDTIVRTSGSVGLDGSLALVAEMPVPARWIGANRLGRALQKQMIRIPIAGTLAQPRMDWRTVREIQSRLVRESAADVIREELGGKLNRLFRPDR